MSVVRVMLFCLSLCPALRGQAFVPVCDPDVFTPTPGDPPVPDLPDQFSFTIEGNLIERNSTGIMTEYYDGPGNRGRLEFGVNGSTYMSIFDYNLGEIFAIPDFRTGDGCRVFAIADSPPFLNFTFGITQQNGSVHIGSPRTFLEGLRDNVATQYVGEEMVRGIPTRRWQACFGAENISYLIDYYFVADSWNYEGQTQMVPVQFTLNTTRLENGTVRDIYHIYSVVDFRAGPDSVPESLFQVPNGLACTGRFPGQPVPQIPQFFSMYVEQTSPQPVPYIQTLREFYDLPHNLFRIDVFYGGDRGGAPGQISIIHDFNTSVQYVVNNQVLGCSAQPLEGASPFFFDIATGEGDSLQLVSPNNFFFLGSEFNYSYEGVSNIRGVDVDSWVSVRDFERVSAAVNLTNGIYEVFFTRPEWFYISGGSVNSDPVPWRIKYAGTVNYLNMSDNSTGMINQSFEMDFFAFSTDEPSYDAFDVSSCSAPDDFYTLVLFIPTQGETVDFGQLRRNIRASVSNYTGLRPLQIGNIQIPSQNETHIFVDFHISNLTSLAKIDPSTNVTAQQAVDLIAGNTFLSQAPFQIQISPNVSVTPSVHVAGRGPRQTSCSVPLVNPDGNCSTLNCATPPDVPQYFSVYAQQLDQNIKPPAVQTFREFYDRTHNLFRFDFYYDGQQGGSPGPLTFIHDLSTSVQYIVGNQVRFCLPQRLQEFAPFFWDLTTGDGGTLELTSPNNLFFRGSQYNYTYQGATNIRGVDVDSWVSYRQFESIASTYNFSNAYYQVFYTRPGWTFSNVETVTTEPVPWRIVINGTVSRLNMTDNTTYTYNTTYEMDLFEFSTDEPSYDAFDISACSAPDDYYTLVLFIPGQETGIDFGQLRRNIRGSVSNFTGLRPLQIGNIQVIRENGTHVTVTLQISNLTSLANIDPSTNVTAQQAVKMLSKNSLGSRLPFQIEIYPNISVTPQIYVLGRGANTTQQPQCNDTSCDCTVPLVNPDGNCSTPNCATPPDVPQYFSVYAEQIDENVKPPTVQTFREFYDRTHNLFRFDFYYDGQQGGSPGPLTFIHDLSTSVQYIVGNQVRFCLPQRLQEFAPYFWDLTTGDGGTLELTSPNNLFFRGSQYNYTYQGATNIRGVDVDSWVSYRQFESIASTYNFSNAYYQVFYTRPGWTFSNVETVTTEPVPWRIVINGTVSRLNMTDNTTYTYNTTYEMDLFEFSTDEPSYDAFDVSACSAPDDYYTLVLFIPGQETGIDFGQLRRNIRGSVSNYTGLRPLQIGNIQLLRDNGTHIMVTLQISNLTSLAKIDPSTNITAQQAVDLIAGNGSLSQAPFQIQIFNVSVTPSVHVAGRGRNTTQPCPTCNCTDCNRGNDTDMCNCTDVNPANTTNMCNTTDGNRGNDTDMWNCTNVNPANTTNMCNATDGNRGNKTNITTQLGLSNGGVAGVTIAVFILGIIVGVVLQLCMGYALRYCRKKGGSLRFIGPFNYERHDEELEDISGSKD